MAQSTILAAGTTAATSTDVTVAAGSTVTLGIFAASGASLPGSGPIAEVMLDTPGADAHVATLSMERQAIQVSGPATYRVTRIPVSANVGVFSET